MPIYRDGTQVIENDLERPNPKDGSCDTEEYQGRTAAARTSRAGPASVADPAAVRVPAAATITVEDAVRALVVVT
jgi:hypothetical protein